jgi:NADPH:quinone reductase-like Zn-dependent oxidoreductase
MKVVQLVNHGNDPSCFVITDADKPTPKAGEVLIKVEGFGLNYADVMARLGLYKDAPPLPAVLGYDVVGIVDAVGEAGDSSKLRKRVVAVTEFGGYAEYAIAREEAAAEIPGDMPLESAAALATQYATAYYAAYQLGNVQNNEHVFIHAAAGGVGLALIQFCKLRNCTMYGTVSSDTKAETIRKAGVQHVIISSKQNVLEELKKLDHKLDVIFDSVGGKGVKIGFKSLKAGGRIICYGGSQLTAGRGPIHLIKFGLSFGFYSPIQLLSQSKSILGVNMLKLMRENPKSLRIILSDILKLLQEKKISMPIGESFNIDRLFEAHLHLQSRKSIGKIVVKW